jgi:hypothetical protein
MAQSPICKWCGSDNFATLQQMVLSSCRRSPTGKHQPYDGGEKREYICIHCGTALVNLKQLIVSPCRKSPHGYHEPMR